uniref:Uncharacterized protein n=1 Tax=Ditylenchus dipsaci TaxID=166011 RepID=A0A915DZ77_9BILA
MGRLEAVKVIYCARVTALGMSYFLEYCKKLSHMEVGHQLAENGLLDMVHETLNQRMPQGVRPTSMHDSRLFYFVLIQEFNPMRTGENKVWRSRNNYPIPWKKTYDNENMHPWVLLQKPYWHSFCFSLHQIYHC